MNLRKMHFWFIAGLGFFLTRALLSSDFRNSAVLYVGIPFTIAVVMHFFVPYHKGASLLSGYLNQLRDTTIILLTSSVFLFEGFICVLMFMPIYYAFTTLGFLFSLWMDRQDRKNGNRASVYLLPLLVVMMSTEGLSDDLSWDRYNEVSFSKTISNDIGSLKSNMAKPISLPVERHWFLSIFPLPVSIDAGSLKEGDIHEVRYIYKKWFFKNIHEGSIRLQISEVGDNYVRTKFLSNTSYLANYVDVEGTEINFTKTGDGRTKVSLRIKYGRLLDPAWYFEPMQDYAMTLMAEYLLESVIERAHESG